MRVVDDLQSIRIRASVSSSQQDQSISCANHDGPYVLTIVSIKSSSNAVSTRR